MLSELTLKKALAHIQSTTIDSDSIFGVNKHTGKPVALYDKNTNLHTLAIGITGSEKTTTILNIIENTITRRLPLFYVDGKGDFELAQKIKSIARKHNRAFYLFFEGR